MGSVALTHIIPLRELAPGQVSAIRNQVITQVVAQASKELAMPPSELVVRDVRPLLDLQMRSQGVTTSTSERWGTSVTNSVAPSFVTVTGAATMADQRFVALYGVRDRGLNKGGSDGATAATAMWTWQMNFSFVLIQVGGADKVVWDISSLRAYRRENACFSSTAVVIPQNAGYNIQYYRPGSLGAGVPVNQDIDSTLWLQLMGITVEPRGKVISP